MRKISVVLLLVGLVLLPSATSSIIRVSTSSRLSTINKVLDDEINVSMDLVATRLGRRTWKFETTLRNNGNNSVIIGIGEGQLDPFLRLEPDSWSLKHIHYKPIYFSLLSNPREPVEVKPGEKINLRTIIWRGWVRVTGPFRLLYNYINFYLPGPAGNYTIKAIINVNEHYFTGDSVTIYLPGLFGR